MRYLMLLYSRETPEGPSPEEVDRLIRVHGALIAEGRQKGVLLGVEGLKPTAAATTVRAHGGKALVTDGPFAETKEQLAGYYMLECKDLEEAVEWAKRIPTSCKGASGCIEIRPLAELPTPPSFTPARRGQSSRGASGGSHQRGSVAPTPGSAGMARSAGAVAASGASTSGGTA